MRSRVSRRSILASGYRGPAALITLVKLEILPRAQREHDVSCRDRRGKRHPKETGFRRRFSASHRAALQVGLGGAAGHADRYSRHQLIGTEGHQRIWLGFGRKLQPLVVSRLLVA